MKYLLVDGKNMLFRAGYASRNLKTQDGRLSGALHGFIKMLSRVRVQHPEAELVIIWEQAGQQTYRHKLFAGYKDRSSVKPNETNQGIHKQIDPIRDICTACGVRWVQMLGLEADDVAGLLTVSLQALGHEILLLSGDKDWWQLAPIPGVTVLCEQGTTRDEPIVTDAKVMATFGCKAKDLLRLRPFLGDTSDKIPRVRPRFMERDALALVQAGCNPKYPLSEQPDFVQQFPDIDKLWPIYVRNYKLMRIARSLDVCGVSVEAFNQVMNIVTGPLPERNYQAMIRVMADWELDSAMANRTFIFSIARTATPVVESQVG